MMRSESDKETHKPHIQSGHTPPTPALGREGFFPHILPFLLWLSLPPPTLEMESLLIVGFTSAGDHPTQTSAHEVGIPAEA